MDEQVEPVRIAASRAAGYRVVDRLEANLTRRAPGSDVPDAAALAEELETTPAAVRRALSELERRFVVRRKQARRLVVSSRIDYRIGSGMLPGLTDAVSASGVAVRSETERVRLQRVPPRVRLELDVGRMSHVYVLSRRRFVDEEPVACSVSYVAADLTPGLPDRLGSEGSLHATIREAFGLKPVPAWVRAEMEVPPPDIPRRLKLGGRPVLVSIRSRTDCARLGRPIEVTASWLRPDVFRVVLEVNGGTAVQPAPREVQGAGQ
jgi:GntR family transcriptional regulator